jgi:hypothetical protein
MFLRTSSALCAVALLAACGSESPPPPGDDIACAIGAGAEFSPVCKLEKLGPTGEFVIHHPDGGFRRFLMVDGEINASDGAGEVEVVADASQDHVEIAVEGDRYRVPNASAKRN